METWVRQGRNIFSYRKVRITTPELRKYKDAGGILLLDCECEKGGNRQPGDVVALTCLTEEHIVIKTPSSVEQKAVLAVIYIYIWQIFVNHYS